MRLGKDLVTVNAKKWPRGWPPSYWAALLLFLGLLGCLTGIVVVLLSPTDVDDLYTQIMPKPETPLYTPPDSSLEPRDMLDKIWASTVWVGREVRPGVTQYIGSGWVIGYDNKMSYIATCAHVSTHHQELPLKIGYLGQSFIWSEAPAKLVNLTVASRAHLRERGDVAIIAVETPLQPIKFANNQKTFTVGDEVYIAGVQWNAPPAIIATGVISVIDRKSHEFQVKGWGWHGFSGGPIILRKTGEVIGYLAWGVKGHINDASRSDCADLTRFMELLRDSKLEHIVQE